MYDIRVTHVYEHAMHSTDIYTYNTRVCILVRVYVYTAVHVVHVYVLYAYV